MMSAFVEQLRLLDLQLQQERLLFSPSWFTLMIMPIFWLGHWVLYGFYILLHKTNKNKTLNLKLRVLFLLINIFVGV
jgi:hypothetical protein